MNRLQRHFTLLCTSFAVLLLVALLPRCVTDAPGAIVLDGGETTLEGGVVFGEGGALYKVSGAVTGLPAGTTATLALNELNPITTGNGAFSFPPLVGDGQPYAVTVTAAPANVGCGVANGKGNVAAADVTGVTVTCGSMDAGLRALALSTAPLVPAFSAKTLAYTASARVSGLFPPPSTTTITGTANDPGATIKINGAAVASGSPSAPIALSPGENAIDVAVTAADTVTTAHYTVALTGLPNDTIKGANVQSQYGAAVAVSGDGNTLVVGAPKDPSNAVGVNGNQADASMPGAGAAFVLTRTGGTWTQQAYLKASNTTHQQMGLAAAFGTSVAVSSDGNTIAVGALQESSGSVGIDGDQTDTSQGDAGAVYVFTRTGTTWTQQAYVKASNTRGVGSFGTSVALSADGSTLAVGSEGESSNATTINGDQSDTSATGAGAVYVFTRTGTVWAQQAYVKASNTRASAAFGSSVALSSDGSTLAAAAFYENSNGTGVGGDQTNTSMVGAGSVYVFTRAATVWSQQVYIKASNTRAGAEFGTALTLSGDGNTLAVGSPPESSNATGINGNQASTVAPYAGAVYVFLRTGTAWAQQAYVKASNTPTACDSSGNGCPMFGSSASLSADGNTLVVGAQAEVSKAMGINGNQADTTAPYSGAAYVLTRTGTTWTQRDYVKASDASSQFGHAIAISGDAKTVGVGSLASEVYVF